MLPSTGFYYVIVVFSSQHFLIPVFVTYFVSLHGPPRGAACLWWLVISLMDETNQDYKIATNGGGGIIHIANGYAAHYDVSDGWEMHIRLVGSNL